MDLNDHYLQAVNAALTKAGIVSDRAALSIASRIFETRPALGDLDGYVEGLQTQLPTHFAPAPAVPAVEAPEVREAVRQAYLLANLEAIAGPETPAPLSVEAPAPPKTISRADPAFPRLFAAHAERIAIGECQVV